VKIVDDHARRLKIVWNFIILVISLFVVATQGPLKPKSSPFDALLIDVLAPLQASLSGGYVKIRNFFENYALSVNASKENRGLHQKIEDYQKRLFHVAEIEKENERLKSLLGFVQEREEKKVFAQVVAYDASIDHKVIRINKGSSSGITLYSPVVTALGLVGYVFRVTENYADVLTLLDSNNRVDGIISRIRTHGIIEGDAEGRCIVKYIPRTKPLILDDVVLTSGLGRIYPKGIKIGTVSEIERDFYGSIQTVFITPSVKFSEIEELIVLIRSAEGIGLLDSKRESNE
jgi:rod shape-determining protein MreC